MSGPYMCFITIRAEYWASVSDSEVEPCSSAPMTWWAHHWWPISWAPT